MGGTLTLTSGQLNLLRTDSSTPDRHAIYACPFREALLGPLDATTAAERDLSYDPDFTTLSEIQTSRLGTSPLALSGDLATATGQDPTLDPELCLAAMAVIERYPPSFWGTGRFFAPRIETASTEPQVRLLAFSGRDPNVRA